MNTLKQLDMICNEYNVTMAEICREAGICPSAFSSTRRRGGQLSVESIEKICNFIGIPVFWFFMTDDDWNEIEKYRKQNMTTLPAATPVQPSSIWSS